VTGSPAYRGKLFIFKVQLISPPLGRLCPTCPTRRSIGLVGSSSLPSWY